MKKSLAYAILTTAMATGVTLGTGGVANAGHCAQNGSTGFSYYGQDGRGEPGDEVAPGASECTTSPAGTPQDRAPGQVKK